MGQTISIIGCNSFLAKHLIQDLYVRKNLTLYGRKLNIQENDKFGAQFIEFDFPETRLNLESILASDVIIYTAAAGVQASNTTSNLNSYSINTFLPIEIIDYLTHNKYKGKVITFGSYFEIGNNNDTYKFSEAEVSSSNLPIPNSYCDSKRLLTRYYNNGQFDINWYHLIIPSLYGYGEDNKRLIPYVINGLLNSEQLKLSPGHQIRQYLHVSDLVSLINQIIDADLNADIYNVTGPDDPIAIKDLTSQIFALLDKPFAKNEEIATRDQSMAYLALDNAKLKAALSNWSANVSLIEGLKTYLK